MSSFWATVCKTVRPMLSDRCLSVLSVSLYVTLVYCGQTVVWIKFRVRPIPCWHLIPDTIGRSCTDTRNDVTYSLGHTYVAHTVHTFQNITSLTLFFETYVSHTLCSCHELLVTSSKEQLIKTQLHALFNKQTNASTTRSQPVQDGWPFGQDACWINCANSEILPHE